MTDEHRGADSVRLVRDDALTGALRAVYAPPKDEGYWTRLERRIMRAIEEQDVWYAVPDRWVRVGLAAAAAAVLIAGSIFLRAQAQIDRSMAYEAIVEVEGLESALAQREPVSQEQATLRKLTGHQ